MIRQKPKRLIVKIDVKRSKKKEAPVLKKELKITDITSELVEDKLNLQIIGENLELTDGFNWTINFDDTVITPSSKTTLLKLSKSNTTKYIEAEKSTAVVSFEDYTSPVFDI